LRRLLANIKLMMPGMTIMMTLILLLLLLFLLLLLVVIMAAHRRMIATYRIITHHVSMMRSAGAERFERRSNLGQKFLLLLSFFPAQRSAERDRA